jgi:phage terminase small subunit
MVNGLNPKKQKFVQEYIKNGGNATKAAQSAGYGDGGHYSRTAGYRLMTSGDIWDSIKRQSEVMGLTPDKVLKRLESIIQKGKDSNSIQAIRVWGDLTGSFAPKAVRFQDELNRFPKDPDEIDAMLKRMRETQARRGVIDNTINTEYTESTI